MQSDSKSRVDESVPKPDDASALSETEKQALEKSGEIEHQHGNQREETAQKAAKT